MDEEDGEIFLAPQVKGFQHSLSPRAQAQANSSTNVVGSPTSTPRLKKSNALSLSLRRVTPDKRSPALDSPRNTTRNHDYHSTTASFVSRFTGRTKNSIYTGATPVAANGKSSRRSLSPSNVERQQKLEDEYYRYYPPRQEEKIDDDEVEDGDLPSLRRVGSAVSRAQDEVSLARSDDKSASRAIVSPTNGMAEQLKVAGFWSQLDDNEGDDSDVEVDRYRPAEEDEMPNDERQWTRAQSPQRGGRAESEAEPVSPYPSGDDGLGLNLANADMEDDDMAKRTVQGTMPPARESDNQWNLLDKAACFAANEKTEASSLVSPTTAENEDQNSSLEQQSYQTYDETDPIMAERCVSPDRSEVGAAAVQSSGNEQRVVGDDEEQEGGVMECITVAIGSICGYAAYESSPNKRKARKIIQRNRRRQLGIGDDESQDLDEVFSELEDEQEDTAIELQFHNQDDGLQLSPAMDSPRKKKRGLKRIFSLRKKKGGAEKSPPRKTLVTTTTISGAGPATEDRTRVTDMNTSMTFEQEILGHSAIDPDGTDECNDAAFGAVADCEESDDEREDKETENEGPGLGSALALGAAVTVSAPIIGGAVLAASAASAIGSSVKNANRDNADSAIDDEEELESEAASWSTFRKNAYLRELADRAKKEYVAKNSSSSVPQSIPSQLTESIEEEQLEEDEVIKRNGTGVPDSSSTTDYNSLNPSEKRQFLRLLNSGMKPSEAARQISNDRGGAIKVDDGEEGHQDGDYEDDDLDFDSQPLPEDASKLSRRDAPGDIVDVEVGESTEPSAQDEEYGRDDDGGDAYLAQRGVSRSDVSQSQVAQDSKASTAGAYNAAAAIPVVPAIVRTRSRSKSRERTPPQADASDSATSDGSISQVDGLLSSGIGYYDAMSRSTNQYDDDNFDSGLLHKLSQANKPRKPKSSISRTILDKVASRRISSEGIADKHQYKSVATSAALPITSPTKIVSSRDDGVIISKTALSPTSREHDDRETKSDFTSRSNVSKNSLASALLFMHRNASKKAGMSNKEWSKLDSDLSLDKLAPSRSHDGPTPSWLLPEDDSEERSDASQNGNVGDGIFPVKSSSSSHNNDAVSNDSKAASSQWSPALSPDIGDSPETPRNSTQEPGVALVERLSTEGMAKASSVATSSQTDSNADSRKGSDDANDTESLMMEQHSYVSSSSQWTSASKSSRRRHKGAASKRLMKSKEAESNGGAKAKGWLGSIRDAASNRGQVWDPARGWVSYHELEQVHEIDHQDYGSKGSMHLVVPSKIKVSPEQDSPLTTIEKEETKEDSLLESQSVSILASTEEQVVDKMEKITLVSMDVPLGDDGTAYENMTVNTASGSIYSSSTAPARRANAKHRPKDRRKIGAPQSEKPIGWKESMEMATSSVYGDRRWDYERGWIMADGSLDDDCVSELTRNTLESSFVTDPSSLSLPAAERTIAKSSPSSVNDSFAQTLPSVAEDPTDSSGLQGQGTKVDPEVENPDQDKSAPASPVKNDITLPQLIEADSDSDKENLSQDKLPSKKRSLNQFIEKSAPIKAAESSFEAVNLSNVTKSSSNSNSFPSMDPFAEVSDADGQSAKEIEVVKEKFSDTDSDLFVLDPPVTESFNMNDISRSSRDPEENVFPNANASEWTAKSSDYQVTKKADPEGAKVSSDDCVGGVSSRAKAWIESVEHNQSAGEAETGTTSHRATEAAQKIAFENTPGTSIDEAEGGDVAKDPPQNLDPPTSNIGSKNAKKAADSWIRLRKGAEQEDNVPPKKETARNKDVESIPTVLGLRAKYERTSRAVVPSEPTIPKEVEKLKPVPVKASQAQENDVVFESTAMGIRLKRGEDGFVRVVSVTEATIGSSIVRDGTIEPEDRILEAAGIDLRSSITNSQWGDAVAKIRSAPRPMKFVVACGPRRQNPVQQQNRPVGLSKPSKIYGSAQRPISSHQADFIGSYRESNAVNTVASTADDESTHTAEQPKDSFFRRIACPSPATACVVPNQTQHTDKGDGSQVPMAHLQFLRTNPTIKRVTNAASRRYPALCGTPATIFEEPADDESKVTNGHVMDRTRSAVSSSNDGSRTMSTFDQESTQMSQSEDMTNEEEDDQCEI